MDLGQMVILILQFCVGLVVFCIGLQAGPGDLSYLLRRPSLLLRTLIAMNIVMPLIAVATAMLFHLRPEVEVALILLSVAPVPPLLPMKERKAGGSMSYAVGLLAVAALAAIVTVPVSITLIGRAFGRDIQVPVGVVLRVVAMTVLVPLVLGALVRRMAPALAERFARPLSMVGMVILLLGLVPILVKAWPAIVSQVGELTLVAIVLFTLVSVAVGHLLGGPSHDDRTVLGLSTAVRHPGLALALSGIVAPGNQGLAGTVLLAALVAAVVTVPYVKLRKRHVALGGPAVQEGA